MTVDSRIRLIEINFLGTVNNETRVYNLTLLYIDGISIETILQELIYLYTIS